MTYKFIIILFLSVMILMPVSCKKPGVKEKEPNNDFLTANRIEQDTVVSGFLDTENDRDFYRIDIMNPVVMDIELSPVKGVNHALKILKDDGLTVLKYIDDSRKSAPELMCNMFLMWGHITLKCFMEKKIIRRAIQKITIL
jgi:hypothetical protein